MTVKHLPNRRVRDPRLASNQARPPASALSRLTDPFLAAPRRADRESDEDGSIDRLPTPMNVASAQKRHGIDATTDAR